MKKAVFTQIAIGLLLLMVGGVFWWLSIAGWFDTVTPPPAVIPAPMVVARTIRQGSPVLLDIPSLHLDLPVIPGVYDPKTKTWTLTADKVQYAVMTPLPNDAEGNTFLYGHYRWGLLASLHAIKPGAQVIITTANGYQFTYTFISSREVPPSDTSLFNYQGKPILTIQTCSGLFFQNRQLFTFTLSGVA